LKSDKIELEELGGISSFTIAKQEEQQLWRWHLWKLYRASLLTQHVGRRASLVEW
jgi:hypothetical protein